MSETSSTATRIRVGAGAAGDPSGPNAYDVVVGHGLLGELPGHARPVRRRVLVVHPRSLRATGEAVREDLLAAGYEAILAEVPDAEEAKTAAGGCRSAGACSGRPGSPGPTPSSASAGER